MKVRGLKDTIQWYDQNTAQYAQKSSTVLNKESIDRFLALLPHNPSILDAGCGAGRDSQEFFKKGARITGIDISEGLLKEARKVNPSIEFIYGDLTAIPFKNEIFDGVWSEASLVHLEKLEDVQKALNECYRVLKPEGALHLYVKKQMGSNETEVIKDSLSNHERFFRYYTEKGLEEILTQIGFSILEIKQSDDRHGRKEVQWLTFIAKK
jgi:ubiquinone/menaquinone biosynthesis C-methylase UbiE